MILPDRNLAELFLHCICLMGLDYLFRESELGKSKQTLEGLKREHSQLSGNLEKIDALEEKIKAEMETLKDKIQSMEESLVVFNDLEKLRIDADVKRKVRMLLFPYQTLLIC